MVIFILVQFYAQLQGKLHKFLIQYSCLLFYIILSLEKKIKTDIYFYGIIINISIFICLSFISSSFIGGLDSDMYINHIFGIFYFEYNLLDLMMLILQFLNAYSFEIILLIYFIFNFESYKKFLNFERELLAS